MENINQVVVNGQNYEVEDKVARNYYPDTKQSAAVVEQNSYKIVDKNGNTIAEFKSDSDISVLLGGNKENAIVKITKDKVEIGNENTEINIKGLYESLKYNNNEIGLILEHSCAKIPGNNKNIIDPSAGNGIIFGYNNVLHNFNSLIGGTDSSSNHDNTFILGKNLHTHKEGQVIVGEYNYQNGTDQDFYSFTVGGGESTNRNNLVHINKKGAYFKGIGGYNGKDFIAFKSLQDIISDFETRIAALEKNSYKVISFTSNLNVLTSLTINDVKYINKENIVEQLKQLKYCVYNESSAPYNSYCLCIIGNGTKYSNNKIKLVKINLNLSDTVYELPVQIRTINLNDLSFTMENKTITLE